MECQVPEKVLNFQKPKQFPELTFKLKKLVRVMCSKDADGIMGNRGLYHLLLPICWKTYIRAVL